MLSAIGGIVFIAVLGHTVGLIGGCSYINLRFPSAHNGIADCMVNTYAHIFGSIGPDMLIAVTVFVACIVYALWGGFDEQGR